MMTVVAFPLFFLHIMDGALGNLPRLSNWVPQVVTSSPSEQFGAFQIPFKVGKCVQWPPWEFLLRRTSTAPGGVKLVEKRWMVGMEVGFSWSSTGKWKEERKHPSNLIVKSAKVYTYLQKAECKLSYLQFYHLWLHISLFFFVSRLLGPLLPLLRRWVEPDDLGWGLRVESQL